MITACDVPVEEPVDLGMCATEGEAEVVVVQELVFSRITDGITLGADLDGAVSEMGGPTGCGGQDYVAPDGTPGIDNAMAGLLPILEATEAAALEPLIQQTINGGELLVLVEMESLQDLYEDECVGVRFLNGQDVPTIGADGFIEPSQTFSVDWSTTGVMVDGWVQDGHLIARDFDFTLPVQIFEYAFEMDIYESYVDLEIQEDGTFSGFIAGGFSHAQMVATLETTAIDQALMAMLPELFESVADLGANDQGGCDLISIVLEVRGTPAFVFPE
jgi:hypothetical protein